jgi:hypothetical protein
MWPGGRDAASGFPSIFVLSDMSMRFPAVPNIDRENESDGVSLSSLRVVALSSLSLNL